MIDKTPNAAADHCIALSIELIREAEARSPEHRASGPSCERNAAILRVPGNTWQRGRGSGRLYCWEPTLRSRCRCGPSKAGCAALADRIRESTAGSPSSCPGRRTANSFQPMSRTMAMRVFVVAVRDARHHVGKQIPAGKRVSCPEYDQTGGRIVARLFVDDSSEVGAELHRMRVHDLGDRFVGGEQVLGREQIPGRNRPAARCRPSEPTSLGIPVSYRLD